MESEKSLLQYRSERGYWNARYSEGYSSGAGSYGTELEEKLNLMKEHITEPINSITEIGCGDFNFGSKVIEQFKVPYFGYDISDVVVDRNKKMFPEHSFATMLEPIVISDLVLCVDVLFHIYEDFEFEKLRNFLKHIHHKYLVISGYEYDGGQNAPHVHIRDVKYKEFGHPLVRKVVEEDGQKYFYIFKKI